MKISRAAAAASTVVLGGLALAGCASTLDTAKLQSSIQGKLGEVDLSASNISCPSSVEVKAGNSFDCTATVNGVPVKVTVTQKDDQGNVSYEIGNEVFSTEKVKPAIQDAFQKQGATSVTVSCPKGVVVAGGNGTFECTATVDGQTAKITVPLENGIAQLDKAAIADG